MNIEKIKLLEYGGCDKRQTYNNQSKCSTRRNKTPLTKDKKKGKKCVITTTTTITEET